jgi:hypothetical protein
MLRVVLANVLETKMTVMNRTDENGDRNFLPYLHRKVVVNETEPVFATAGTIQSNSIRAKDPAMSDDPGWRLSPHWLSVPDTVSAAANRSSGYPDPEKERMGFARISRAHQEAKRYLW